MPAYKRVQRAVMIQSDRDCYIITDSGRMRVMSGDYLILADDGSLGYCRQDYFPGGWEPDGDEPHDMDVGEAEERLNMAIQTGHW